MYLTDAIQYSNTTQDDNISLVWAKHISNFNPPPPHPSSFLISVKVGHELRRRINEFIVNLFQISGGWNLCKYVCTIKKNYLKAKQNKLKNKNKHRCRGYIYIRKRWKRFSYHVSDLIIFTRSNIYQNFKLWSLILLSNQTGYFSVYHDNSNN